MSCLPLETLEAAAASSWLFRLDFGDLANRWLSVASRASVVLAGGVVPAPKSQRKVSHQKRPIGFPCVFRALEAPTAHARALSARQRHLAAARVSSAKLLPSSNARQQSALVLFLVLVLGGTKGALCCCCCCFTTFTRIDTPERDWQIFGSISQSFANPIARQTAK